MRCSVKSRGARGGTNLYLYGLDDSGCTSYIEALGVSDNEHVTTLFENSRLTPTGAGPQILRNRNGSTVFLHSEVIGSMGVDLFNEPRTMESIVSLHSTHAPWAFSKPLDDTNFESRSTP